MSNQFPDPTDLHPTDLLPLLLAGELSLGELRSVVTHTRRCPDCQAELVEVAAGFGALRGVALTGLTEIDDPPPLAVHPIEATPVRPVEVDAVAAPDVEVEPDAGLSGAGPSGAGRPGAGPGGSNRVLRLVGAAAAAVLLVLGGVVVGTRLGGTDAGPPPLAQVAFEPKSDIDASGTVAMADVEGTDGAEQIMSVETSQLPPAQEGEFYEVWLLQPDTGQMLAVGVLPNGGAASFALPADLVANYQAVDVSLQADDGGVVHSGNSILRATYA